MPAAQLIKIMMGLGKMIQITQSLTDDDVQLIGTELEREVTIRHAADEEPEPESLRGQRRATSPTARRS